MQITEIITDETLREIREHGTPEFPFEYYLDDIGEMVRVMLNGTGIMRLNGHGLNLEK